MKSILCVIKTGLYSRYLILLLVMGSICVIGFPLACADFPETHYWNPYEGWDIELSSVAGIGLFPTVEVDWTPKPTSGPLPKSTAADTWVKLAYYPPGTEEGQPALLAGYVGGRNYNAEVTITEKMEVADDFQNIVTIKAQENGIFVWAIPDSLEKVKYYQAVATVSGSSAKSEIVATSGISGYVPVDSGTIPPLPVASSVPELSHPVITSLTLSANTMRPMVGESVELTGRLTDNSGKGVAKAEIVIEVPDYGTDFLPLTSTTTDGDGRFSATINTIESGGVPVRAVYEGDDTHLSSTSNTLIFYASVKSTNN